MAQITLLARGLNFAVVSLYSAKGKYIVTVEEACLKLAPRWQRNLGRKPAGWLNRTASLKPNISMEKAGALKKLKQDKSRIMITAISGVVMVVLEKQDYSNKAQDQLAQRDTYRPLVADSTNKHKNKLMSILGTIKAQEGLGAYHLPKTIPNRYRPSKILWATQSVLKGHFLRPTVSSRAGLTHGVAKELANILRQLVGHSPHHIRTLKFCETRSKLSDWGKESALHPMMWRSFHICSSGLCNLHNQT